MLLQVAAVVDTFHHSSADSVLVYGALAHVADRWAWWKQLPFSAQAMILGPIISVLFHYLELILVKTGKKVPWLAGFVARYEAGGGGWSALTAAAVWGLGTLLTGNLLPGIVGSGIRAAWVAIKAPPSPPTLGVIHT